MVMTSSLLSLPLLWPTLENEVPVCGFNWEFGSIWSHCDIICNCSKCGSLTCWSDRRRGKSQDTYTEAFKMLQHLTADIHQESCLNPIIGITDDDEALRNALKIMWPNINFFVSFPYFTGSGICKEDRQDVFLKFKLCVYSEREKIEGNKSIVFNLPALLPKCTAYFSALWKCCSNWIWRMHSTKIMHGYDTNNYCEASVRLICLLH